MVALLLGGLLLIDLSVDLLFGFAWRPLPFAMVQNAAILGFSIWLAGQVLGVSSGVLSFDGVQLAAPSPLPAGNEDRRGEDASLAGLEMGRASVRGKRCQSGFI